MRMIEPEKMSQDMAMPAKEIYPHFGIDLKNLPEAKKWKIGEKYKITLEVKMTGMNMHQGKEGENGYADFDMMGVETSKGKKDYKLLYKE